MYELKQGKATIQRSKSITDLQRIAGNLNINTYSIYYNWVMVYSVKGGF